MAEVEDNSSLDISRHKTAIRRTALSRPIRQALSDGVIFPGVDVLDYGCGHGDDIRLLMASGYDCAGWDPIWRPVPSNLRDATVVNLGYVVNVIEDEAERAAVLARSWGHTKGVLIVSARLSSQRKEMAALEFQDGLITSNNTFQKFYDQVELRDWIESVLNVTAAAAAPGVFYVFKNPDQRESFLANRVRQRLRPARIRVAVTRLEESREALTPLLEFLEDRGRLPDGAEIDAFTGVMERFGSLKRALRLIIRLLGQATVDRIKSEKASDLLVYLALGRFNGRPRQKRLPTDLVADVRAFFGTYRKACSTADELLFSVGRPDVLEQAFHESSVGKLTKGGLYVHETAIPLLPPVLRVFEGCAGALVGRVEGGNIIKLHRDAPRISYLSYPTFDSDAHPALLGSLLVNLQTLKVSYRDYADFLNPPILHRKETFVSHEDARWERFARLTQEEEANGLYYDPALIGNLQGWRDVLARKGVQIIDHRVIRTGSSDQ